MEVKTSEVITFDLYDSQETVNTKKTKAEMWKMGISEITGLAGALQRVRKSRHPSPTSHEGAGGHAQHYPKEMMKWEAPLAKPNSAVLRCGCSQAFAYRLLPSLPRGGILCWFESRDKHTLS